MKKFLIYILNKEKKPEKGTINIGIELLRFLLCLWVVIIHCSFSRVGRFKFLTKGFHVPTFFMISFYYNYQILNNMKITKIKSRFQRMLIPYILWPLLIFISNNLLLRLFSLGQFGTMISFKDLFLQILTGSEFHPIFWFLFNLIFLNIIFTIIALIFKRKFLIFLIFLSIFSLYLHFSGIYANYFSSYHKRFKISIGSLIVIIPIAILGYIFSSLNLLLKMKNIPIYIYVIHISLLYLLFKYDIFTYYPGFIYPNVFLNISASTLFFITFGSFNFNKYFNNCIFNEYLTKYTGGIYYIHPIIRDYLQKKIIFFRDQTYHSSLIIYIICYTICFFGNNITKHNKLKYLFL